ncbi:MAG: hypothetical protein ACRESA_02520, partial [Gammaproteobacteria bacterium]
VVQLLNETTVLADEASNPGEQLLANRLGIATSNSSSNLVRVIFGRNSGAPANGTDFSVLVKGIGAYKFQSLAGEEIVPSVTVLYEIQSQ